MNGLWLVVERPDGTACYTNDPHVPKLRLMRAELARLVEQQQLTNESALAILHKQADMLAGVRRPYWGDR